MIKLTVDHALQAKLDILKERAEICDNAGRVLGYFMPVVDASFYEGVDAPMSEEELRRSESGGGRPLKDILSDLERSG